MSIKQYTQETSKTIVAHHALVPERIQTQNYVVASELPPGNRTMNEPVLSLNCSKNVQLISKS